jgi:hypothetical protein
MILSEKVRTSVLEQWLAVGLAPLLALWLERLSALTPLRELRRAWLLAGRSVHS